MSKHVDVIALTIFKTIDILKWLRFYPQDISIHIYQSLITPHYNYGLLLWRKNIRFELLKFAEYNLRIRLPLFVNGHIF